MEGALAVEWRGSTGAPARHAYAQHCVASSHALATTAAIPPRQQPGAVYPVRVVGALPVSFPAGDGGDGRVVEWSVLAVRLGDPLGDELAGAGGDVSSASPAVARLLSRLAPTVGVLRLPAAAISRDPAVVRAYEQDPLVHRGPIPARTAVELLDAMRGFAGSAGRLRVPTLVLHGTADRLVRIEHAQRVWRAFGTPDLTVHRYEGLYHEVFNEPERARVYADLDAWLAARL